MADQTNWRRKVRKNQMACTDEVKAIYLAELEAHGRKHHAAQAAGVSYMSIFREIERDSEFADAANEALGLYADRVKARQQELVFKDEETVTLGKDGKPSQINRRAYEKSVHKELEATAPEQYRPGYQVDITAKQGGVLVVAESPDIEAFAREAEAMNAGSEPPSSPLTEGKGKG